MCGERRRQRLATNYTSKIAVKLIFESFIILIVSGIDCVYVRVCIYIYAYIYKYIYICIRVCVHICVYTCFKDGLHVETRECVCVCICV